MVYKKISTFRKALCRFIFYTRLKCSTVGTILLFLCYNNIVETSNMMDTLWKLSIQLGIVMMQAK